MNPAARNRISKIHPLGLSASQQTTTGVAPVSLLEIAGLRVCWGIACPWVWINLLALANRDLHTSCSGVLDVTLSTGQAAVDDGSEFMSDCNNGSLGTSAQFECGETVPQRSLARQGYAVRAFSHYAPEPLVPLGGFCCCSSFLPTGDCLGKVPSMKRSARSQGSADQDRQTARRKSIVRWFP